MEEGGFTSGNGPSSGAGLIMPLASIAGAPCCDHTACGAAFGPGADVGGVSHAQAPAVERMRPVALPNTAGASRPALRQRGTSEPSPGALHATHRRTMSIHRTDAVHARSKVEYSHECPQYSPQSCHAQTQQPPTHGRTRSTRSTNAVDRCSSQVHTLSAHGTDAAAVHTGATCSQVYSEYSQQRCSVPTSESPITMLIFHPLQCEHAPCYVGAVRAALMYDGTVPKSTP